MRAIIFLAILLISPLSIAQKVTLTAVGDPWPVLLNPEIKQQGLLVQIVREALQTQGYELEMNFVPWSRAMVLIQKKRADLLIGAWYTEERNKYLLYSDVIFSSSIRLIKNSESDFEFEGIPSLKGKRVGTILSYQYGDEFLRHVGIERITSDNLLNNIHNLLAGRIDLTLDDHYVVRYMLDKHIKDWKNRISLVKKPFSKKDLYLAANRSNPMFKTIIEAFNSGLEQLKEEGRYESIISSYDLYD